MAAFDASGIFSGNNLNATTLESTIESLAVNFFTNSDATGPSYTTSTTTYATIGTLSRTITCTTTKVYLVISLVGFSASNTRKWFVGHEVDGSPVTYMRHTPGVTGTSGGNTMFTVVSLQTGLSGSTTFNTIWRQSSGGSSSTAYMESGYQYVLELTSGQ